MILYTRNLNSIVMQQDTVIFEVKILGWLVVFILILYKYYFKMKIQLAHTPMKCTHFFVTSLHVGVDELHWKVALTITATNLPV